jgi:hypothetical protein
VVCKLFFEDRKDNDRHAKEGKEMEVYWTVQTPSSNEAVIPAAARLEYKDSMLL